MHSFISLPLAKSQKYMLFLKKYPRTFYSLKLLNIHTFYCFPYHQTSVQVPSPASGVIEELLVPDGGKVEGGTPLFKLRKGGLYYCIFPTVLT